MRVEALEAFRDRLTVLQQQIEEARISADFDLEEPFYQRVISVEALAAVSAFVDAVGWGNRLTEPFLKMMVSFEHLDAGVVDPVFTVEREKGKPNTSHMIMNLRGRVAAVQKMLMTYGLSETEAASFALRQLGEPVVNRLRNSTQAKSARMPVTHRTIQRWRSDLNTGKEGDPFALEGFGKMNNIISSQAISGLDDAKRCATKMFRGIAIAAANILPNKSA